MRLDSARDLKMSLMTDVVTPIANVIDARTVSGALGRPRAFTVGAAPGPSGAELIAFHAAAVGAQPVDKLPSRQRSIALGISANRSGSQYKLAIRVQRPALLHSEHVDRMVKHARGEADVRVIGRVDKRHPASRKRPSTRSGALTAAAAGRPWYQSRTRPLFIGASIGHHLVTAGSLGCFVKGKGSSGQLFVLSNNHVLANENAASPGDAILQPGTYDGGRDPKDDVAMLARWVKLERRSPNRVDCALASLDASVTPELDRLRGIGKSGKDGVLSAMCADDVLDEGLRVRKVGRTTGATAGRVTAFEVDNVVVNFGVGNLRFDGQIEIESTGRAPFSDGGDSGSLIVTDDLCALALLFAGSETGGSNGHGLTYANPLALVLKQLKVTLAL